MNPMPLQPSRPLAAPVQASLEIGLGLVEDRLLAWTDSSVAFLREGSHEILTAGGKRFRPSVCLLGYLANGGQPFSEQVLDAAALLELFHTATLVHDDIIDDADTRRGRPSAHRKYGASRAILLGDHIFSAGSSALPRLPPPVQSGLLRSATLLAEGEALEMELTRAGAATLEDYFVVIAKKTASLVEASAFAGAWLANPSTAEAFAEFGFQAGIAFQLVDDLLDIEGVTEITGKPAKWDLERGVPNAAVLMTLEADLRGKPAPLTLPRGVQDRLEDVLARISEVGGDERVRRLARMYGTRALEALDRVPASQAQAALRQQVVDSLTRLS